MFNLPVLERPIDNTAQSAFMNCPKEFFFGMVLHRRSREESSPLSFGSVWHKILEIHYKSGADIVAVEDGVRAYVAAHPMPVSSDYRTLERALMDYKKKYLSRPERTLSKDLLSTIGFPKNPMVELTTSIQGGKLEHPYAGKLDRLVSDELNFVEDHKTTSRFDKHYFSQYELSNQMMGYTYMANLLVPGANFVGVRINVYHVLTEKTDFKSQLVTFSKPQLDGWADNYNSWSAAIRLAYWSWRLQTGLDPAVLGLPDQLIDFMRQFNSWPAHFGDNGCSRKFGLCSYFHVCKLSPKIQMRALEQDFDVKPWNPLDADED